MKMSLVLGLTFVSTVAMAQSVPKPTDLGTLGGGFSTAADINDKDQIVGSSFTSPDQLHAFLWAGGKFTELGTLGGPTSRANGINKHGEVVGASTATTTSADEVAFVWRGHGNLVNL